MVLLILVPVFHLAFAVTVIAFVAATALAMADRRSARIQDWQRSVKTCVDAAARLERSQHAIESSRPNRG